jgi:hypothetical protein
MDIFVGKKVFFMVRITGGAIRVRMKAIDVGIILWLKI